MDYLIIFGGGALLYMFVKFLDKLNQEKYPTFVGCYITLLILSTFLYSGYCLYFILNSLGHFAIPVRMVQ